MKNEELQNIKDLISDMRERASCIEKEAYALLAKAKVIEAESYTVENKFQHLLYPTKAVDDE